MIDLGVRNEDTRGGVTATQEAERRRIEVQSQPRQIVHETLFQKKQKPKH
jgi:hypothetical protein